MAQFMTPKPRKHQDLRAVFKMYSDLQNIRKDWMLRESAAGRGASKSIPVEVIDYIEEMERLKEEKRQILVSKAEEVGPIFDWLTSIKGIGEDTASKLLAEFDNPEKFDTVAKFWRYAGWGLSEYWVNEDGKVMAPKEGWVYRKLKKSEKIPKGTLVLGTKGNKKVMEHKVAEPKDGWVLKKMRDRRVEGWVCPYNNNLKAVLYIIAKRGFIMNKSLPYVDYYYSYKERKAKERPDLKKHILDKMAKRYAIKMFLKKFWIEWRELEGLPVGEEYGK